MRPIKRLASLFALLSVTSLYCQEIRQANVLVFYGKTNPDKIRDYKYVILESEQFNRLDIKLMKESNELVLGYISMGEVAPARYYYTDLKDKTLGKNEIWDSYYLNPADSTTRSILMNLVDRIKEKGFNGLFLDTVDAYGPWGSTKDKVDDFISLLQEIKQKYPDFHLMQNSGVPLVSKSKDYINSVALESVVTDYNFDKSTYNLRTSRGFEERVKELKEMKSAYNMPVVLIEYADTKRLYNRVKQRLIPLKWDYFIGNIDLAEIPKFK